MSTQVERPYRILTDNLTIQDTLKLKTPFAGSITYYQQYMRQLDRNTERLRVLFPNNKKEPMRELLEELDNNYEMAIEILKQESEQVSHPKLAPQSPIPSPQIQHYPNK